MTKLLLTKCTFFLATLMTGNLFWFLFAKSLQTEPLLTNSPIRIALSFLFPILIFSFYLPNVLLFSLFIRSKIIWFITIVISFSLYPYILGLHPVSFVGLLVITSSVFLFLFNFQQSRFIFHNKSSILGQFSYALTITTVVISVVIAINFYTFYKNVLATTNTVLSDNIFITSLRPILMTYYDDLKVTNGKETFKHFIQRKAGNNPARQEQVKSKTLLILGLQNASTSSSMSTLIETALQQNLVKVFSSYKRQIPVLISLGLGIITQTLLTISSFLASCITYTLLRLFTYFGLLEMRTRPVIIDEITSREKA